MTESLRLEILGPLRLWRGGAELQPGPRQQAYLLGVLLAREGQPISTAELVDLIWGEQAPATALNVIHKYVGALRRLLEPSVPNRGAGSHLHRRGTSYLFTAVSATLDLTTFRGLVRRARAELAGRRPEAALDDYLGALALWKGQAGEGLSPGPVFAALDEEFHGVCAEAAELAITVGRPEAVLPALRLAASTGPLHEPVHAGLISVLDAAGHRAEALAAYEAVRERLADQLGIDPGPALRDVHRRLTRPAPGPPPGLIGRAEEFAVLGRAVESARAGGTGLVVVEGEPGAGKTWLIEEAAAMAAREGLAVVLASCPDDRGMPAMWPWVQSIGRLLAELPAAERPGWLAGELSRLIEPSEDAIEPVRKGAIEPGRKGAVGPGAAVAPGPDAGSQFRLFERIVALAGHVAAARPVLLLLDDLQWADEASLRMLTHLAQRLPARVAVAGAMRDRAPAPGPELSRMLAAVSRVPGLRRIHLGPFSPAEVAELVRRETGRELDAAAVRRLHARTGGNPFFARELSRFQVEAGGGVPSTVRDVVRDRMAGLCGESRELLRVAALIGRDIDLPVLAAVAGLEVGACLERLEPVEALGLLTREPLRFAHDLVRESVSETMPPHRAGPLHLRIADALERGAPAAERLAHHLWSAGPLADPARTASALVRAGRRAIAKSALEAAERHLGRAAQAARSAGRAELELAALAELIAVAGMRSMYGAVDLERLERAERLARELGRDRAAADFLFSRWAALAQGLDLDAGGKLARRLLEEGETSADPVLREYGRHAWGIYLWSVGDIGEAFRWLSRCDRRRPRREDDPMRHDFQLLSAVMFAETTAVHGDPATAWSQIDALEAVMGDDPYVVTVWATFSVRIAVLTGEPDRALRAARRGIAVDPDFSFRFLGTYQRLGRCWALAVTGHDPAAAAAEAEQLITTMLLDPPRSCVSTWYGLLAEMLLAAGAPDRAAAALDRADHCLDAFGQRYAEGLLLLLRARVLAAQGRPPEMVRAAAEKAYELSIGREAGLFLGDRQI
ncbi:BTAD domain-containing putative transcriptional regulator [Actinoplanes sp. NPDC049596]|uniref:BTAD domain-containing putative transcriptional regulator n=1 Tax=unclassified Actinoplanes TaxID=2626549 RepID=UPI00343CE668